MEDWIFDGINKIIKEPTGAGDATFDVGRDIYSAWKRWVASGNGQYESAFSVEGGTPIGATGLFTGTTFILTNGWKLQTADHNGQVIIIGNLYSDDGIVSTNNLISNRTLFASGTIGAQVINTGGSSSSIWTFSEKDSLLAYSKKASDNAEQVNLKIN